MPAEFRSRRDAGRSAASAAHIAEGWRKQKDIRRAAMWAKEAMRIRAMMHLLPEDGDVAVEGEESSPEESALHTCNGSINGRRCDGVREPGSRCDVCGDDSYATETDYAR